MGARKDSGSPLSSQHRGVKDAGVEKRFVFEHYEADWLFQEIDGAVPGLRREQRLG